MISLLWDIRRPDARFLGVCSRRGDIVCRRRLPQPLRRALEQKLEWVSVGCLFCFCPCLLCAATSPMSTVGSTAMERTHHMQLLDLARCLFKLLILLGEQIVASIFVWPKILDSQYIPFVLLHSVSYVGSAMRGSSAGDKGILGLAAPKTEAAAKDGSFRLSAHWSGCARTSLCNQQT